MSGPPGFSNDRAVLAAVNAACAASGGGLRPALTAAPRGALRSPGRDGETPPRRTKKHHGSYGPAILQNLTHITRQFKHCRRTLKAIGSNGHRGVAQSGSASALGAEGRVFESR